MPIGILMGARPHVIRDEMLGALRRSEYAYVTDVVAQVGGTEAQRFENWCQANSAAFR